jgi:Zn-dependent protease with chaperone function
MADDSALAERIAAHRRRVLQVFAATTAVLIVSQPGTLVWTLPLLILSRCIAAFPSRRILLGESWALGRYLAGGFRLYLAVTGFWILLACAPLLARYASWWTALIAGAVLMAWNHWYSEVLLRLLGAGPLTSQTLGPHFAQVVANSGISCPRVWRAASPGAVTANALALPPVRGTSVLFTETLLERLQDDETTAIFAHEVAHLEQHDRKRLGRFYSGAVVGGDTRRDCVGPARCRA